MHELLKAGLVNEKQAKQVSKQKQKQQKRLEHKGQVEEGRLPQQRGGPQGSQAEKAGKRDQELNRQQQEKARAEGPRRAGQAADREFAPAQA